MNLQRIFLIFIITSVLYLVSLAYVPYPFQFVVKVVPIVILFMICIRFMQGPPRILFALAIFASGIGDICLALRFADSFVFGLGAFLLAQIIYTSSFYRFRITSTVPVQSRITALLLVVYGVAIAWYILPDTGEMLIPVSLYLVVIVCMGIMAQLSNLSNHIKLGALVFISSDTVLALSLFKQPLPYSPWLIMITYYAAQGLIIKGASRINYQK